MTVATLLLTISLCSRTYIFVRVSTDIPLWRQNYALWASLISCDECAILRLCAQLNVNVNYIMSGSTRIFPSPGFRIKMETKEGRNVNKYNNNTRNFVMGLK